MSRRAASRFSWSRVLAWPVRTAFASLPRAVFVRFGRFFSVCFLRAPTCAFLTLRFAARLCVCVAIVRLLSLRPVAWLPGVQVSEPWRGALEELGLCGLRIPRCLRPLPSPRLELVTAPVARVARSVRRSHQRADALALGGRRIGAALVELVVARNEVRPGGREPGHEDLLHPRPEVQGD